MHWVTCNKCWVKFQPNFKFCLSECGHILCGKCVQSTIKTKRCLICNKTAVAIELGKNMESTTQMFFWPLENVFNQSLKIYSFQAMHRSIFAQALSKKYNYAKNECVRYFSANRKLQKDIKVLREMLQVSEANPPPFPTSSMPTSNRSNQSTPNNWPSKQYTLQSEHHPGRAQRVGYPQQNYFLHNNTNQQSTPRVGRTQQVGYSESYLPHNNTNQQSTESRQGRAQQMYIPHNKTNQQSTEPRLGRTPPVGYPQNYFPQNKTNQQSTEPHPGRVQRVGYPQNYLPQNETNQQSSMPTPYQQGPFTTTRSSSSSNTTPSQYQAIPQRYPTPVHGSLKRPLQNPSYHTPTFKDKYKKSSFSSTMYRR
ncbi:unnamed protein product [Ceutorhynchus assimilis]|uniref:RING-type domain-containing protein n=1 Tax=Ceutorhynchus assimilis TaxID=467358 RepID=A0A9N9QBP7_9CUCU|nr:unnamed protein product [Ceutorhynchus assimilis]